MPPKKDDPPAPAPAATTDEDPELGPMTHIDVPNTFQGWCALISKLLAPAEELSPFKLGQIQKLISDINTDAGLFVAPGFAVGQIVFLIAFCVYLAATIYALVADFGAASDSCATDSWVWLYVLLALAIPTGLGVIMAGVKTVLNAVNLKKRFGWEVPPPLLSFIGPVSAVALGVIGILLWAYMSAGCASSYESKFGFLFVIFKIQVIMLGVAAIFGGMTTVAQVAVLMNQFVDPDLAALKKEVEEAEGKLRSAEKDYIAGAEAIVAKLKKEVAEAERRRDEAEAKVKADAEPQEEWSFNEFSSKIVTWLSPVEELSPFKLAQIQELVVQIHKDTGDAIAPFFAVAIVFFLLAFCAYLACAIVALVLDFEAMDAECAGESWVWLYVLLAVVIPTSLGFVMGVVRAMLIASGLDQWVPPVATSLPGPILYVVLGVLGIVLWATMTEECGDYYSESTGFLFIIFKVQVILLGVAAIFGLITVVAQVSVMIAQFTGGSTEEAAADSKKDVKATGNIKSA